MSRPISIANTYKSETLASESLGKSIGAQQIVDSICGSPISIASRHVSSNPIIPKSDPIQDTPEYKFSQYMAQAQKGYAQNSNFNLGPSQPCNCIHHNILNAQTVPGSFLNTTLNNNYLGRHGYDALSLFSSQNSHIFPPGHAHNVNQLASESSFLSTIGQLTEPHILQQLQNQGIRAVQPPASNIFTNSLRDTSVADDLLSRYRANPSMMKSLKLSDIRGLLLKFAKDQVGSRFIQQKLEFSDNKEKDAIFDEVIEHSTELVDDIFGNYVVQKFFEYGEAKHWARLVDAIIERVPQYAFQMYACRVLQKALEKVDEPLQIRILAQIHQVISRCMKDQNGNHVIQKAIEKVKPRYIQFIVDTLLETETTVFEMSVDPYGCRVVQRCLEHCIPAQTRPIIERIHARFDEVANNQYGNYVVQHVIQHGSELDRMIIVERVAHNLLNFATHKYSSNVIEKCLELGAVFHKSIIVRAACHQPEGSVPIVVQMMKDQYANYVVQKMFDQVTIDQRRELILAVRPHIPLLRQYPHGKHILAKLDKYFQKQVLTNYPYECPLDH